MTYTQKQREKAVWVHAGCGGLVVPAKDTETPVCVECGENLHNDSQIERHP